LWAKEEEKMEEERKVQENFRQDEIDYMKKNNIKRYYTKCGRYEAEIEFFDKAHKKT